MIYDRTCRGRALRPGLSHAWAAGQHLYRGLGRLDAAFGAASWTEALGWLADHGGETPIAEVQIWGHGRWGIARMGDEILDAGSLQSAHHNHPALVAVRRRMLPGSDDLAAALPGLQHHGATDSASLRAAWIENERRRGGGDLGRPLLQDQLCSDEALLRNLAASAVRSRPILYPLHPPAK